LVGCPGAVSATPETLDAIAESALPIDKLMTRCASAVFLMLLVAASCSSIEESGDASGAHRLDPDLDARRIEQLIEQLGAVAGEFTDDIPPRFSHEELFLEIATFGEDAVQPLAHCFDDERVSRTMHRGTRLRLGHLCMAAFRYVAYHEAVDEQGDIDGSWIGYAGLSATAEELRQAAAAWRAVIDAGQYVGYPNW
jgi:hypothetical protein